MKWIVATLFAILVLWSGNLPAGEIPAGAKLYAPGLVKAQRAIWPDAPEPWTLAGQVEQESCITLRHSRCWNPRAELKTSREYGFGFGQITTAYRADGSVRFDKFEELRARYSSLRDWAWEDRYDPERQLIALVEMDRGIYRRVRDAATVRDRIAFWLSGYNGGESGVLQDRRLCGNTPKCDPSRWFGHVARTSLKARKVNPGYGKSSYEINREYVTLILDARRNKYRSFWGV